MKTYTLFPEGMTQKVDWKDLPYAPVLLFLAHLAAAQAGYLIYQNAMPAIIWPAAGIALAGLVVGGKRLWPAITAASIANSLIMEYSLLIGSAIAVGSTAQAYLAASLLEWFSFEKELQRLRDAFVFIIVSLFASVVGPLIITTALLIELQVTMSVLGETLGHWWLGSASSFIIFGGLLVTWFSRWGIKDRSYLHWAENGAALLLAAVIAYAIAWTAASSLFGISLIYLLLVPLFWLALRTGPRWVMASLFSVTIIFLTGVSTVAVSGGESTIAEQVIAAEMLSLVLTIIFLLQVSVSEERRQSLWAYRSQVTQLEDVIKKVREDEKIKTEFLAVLAHELRNPLAPILSSIELMKVSDDPRGRIDIMTGMEERVRTMARLLDDLLDISRITRNQLVLHKEKIDVRPVIERSIESVRPLLDERQHTLIVSVPKRPLFAEVDPVRLEQITVNLLTNAAKYTDPKGRISLTLEHNDEMVQLRVSDNGVGIAPKMLSLVFEPFMQLENSKERTSGLGVGLSLAKRLVEVHQGEVVAESAGLGKGATFTVRLPALPTDQPPSARSPQPITAPTPENGRSFGTKRVLVVDDNRAAAEGIEKLLRYKGYDTTTAFSGEEALTAAARFVPEVILLDIGLPDISGLEVATRLRKDGSSAVLIALSGYGQLEDKEEASMAGCDEHITKPVGIDDLHSLITEKLVARPGEGDHDLPVGV